MGNDHPGQIHRCLMPLWFWELIYPLIPHSSWLKASTSASALPRPEGSLPQLQRGRPTKYSNQQWSQSITKLCHSVDTSQKTKPEMGSKISNLNKMSLIMLFNQQYFQVLFDVDLLTAVYHLIIMLEKLLFPRCSPDPEDTSFFVSFMLRVPLSHLN